MKIFRQGAWMILLPHGKFGAIHHQHPGYEKKSTATSAQRVTGEIKCMMGANRQMMSGYKRRVALSRLG